MFCFQMESQASYHRKVFSNIWNNVFAFYPSSPLTSVPLTTLHFLFVLTRSAYCSEQTNSLVVGQITLSSSVDLASLSWKIYYQSLLVEKPFHINLSFWILKRRLCCFLWLQGTYVRPLEPGFHFHYDNVNFHIWTPARHPTSALPFKWMSLFELCLCEL